MSKNKAKAKSPVEMTVDELAGIVGNSFNDLHGRIGHFEQHVEEKFATLETKLDQIEFFATGQGRRIEILEDRIRQIATKVGLDFKKS